jgi:diguanylate cyclase (GGDEF)-like protein
LGVPQTATVTLGRLPVPAPSGTAIRSTTFLMPRPMPPSIDASDPVAQAAHRAPATAARAQRRSVAAIVEDALAQPNDVLRTARDLLKQLGEPRGWSRGGLWQPSAATGDWHCEAHWYHDEASGVASLRVLPGSADASALRAMLSNRATAQLFELAPQPPAGCERAAGSAMFERALRMPLRVGDRVVGVLEWLGRAGDAQSDELLAHADLLSRTLGLLLDHHRATIDLQQFRHIVDALPDMVYLVDRTQMRFVYANVTACRDANYTFEQYTRLGPHDVMPVSREQLEQSYDALIAEPGKSTTLETMGIGAGNRKAYIELRRSAIRVGDRWMILSISRNVSERKLAERMSQRLARMFNSLVATNEALLHATTRDALFESICAAAVEGGNFMAGALVLPGGADGMAQVVAASGPMAAELRKARIATDPTTAEGRGLVGEALRTAKPAISQDFLNDERTRPWHAVARMAKIVSAAAVPIVLEGKVLGVLVFYSADKRGLTDEVVLLLQRMSDNIAFALNTLDHEEDRARSHERISYLANHDALTGLPNRLMFGEQLESALLHAQRYQRACAVLFIDLDRFKVINDSLGHDAGDELLQAMSVRLKSCLRASDIVARLGGDEFVVLLREVTEVHHIGSVARKILDAALEPIELNGQECRISASVGISVFPTDAQDAATLMKNADMAMYSAKEEGKNNFQFFSSEIRSQSMERLTLETRLRRAVEREELLLHYQPKLDVRSGVITGVEALLRWQSPDQGMVGPSEFIALAEETGLIVPIGRWVLSTACAQNVAWIQAGLLPVSMAVNLSARQFANDSLVEDVEQALRESGMPAHLLELEITEGMVITNPERALRVLSDIKAMGVRLAIDDFGTGYSSLAQLKHFPIDTLKVDRSFIRDIPNNNEDRAITEAIIAMGKSLGLNVVAEGVETVHQLDFLRHKDCDEMQGFYFSKPVAPDDLAQLLRRHQAAQAGG